MILDIKESISCCFTGYRPAKFPFSLSEKSREYTDFENLLIKEIFSAYGLGCRRFYSGMAMGFDIIAAEAVLDLKRIKPDTMLCCAVPFKGQSSSYSSDWSTRYNNVLKLADEIVYVCDAYSRDSYFKRNKYMVDNSDMVITWFDGRSGGTANTVKYAKRIGRTVINLYRESGE